MLIAHSSPCLVPTGLSFTEASRSQSREADRGFTLVELMMVVCIVGVLAGLAVYGVRKYIVASKTTEALAMVSDIMAAQESFRAETFNYLNISSDYTSGLHPVGMPSPNKNSWDHVPPLTGAAAQFARLNVSAAGPVYFTYGCHATTGNPSSNPPVPANPMSSSFFTATAGRATAEPYFVAFGWADLDGDASSMSDFDKLQSVWGSSFDSRVSAFHEGE